MRKGGVSILLVILLILSISPLSGCGSGKQKTLMEKGDYAIDFTGKRNQITLLRSFPFGDGVLFTIEAWIKTEDTKGAIFSRGIDTNATGFTLYVDGNSAVLGIKNRPVIAIYPPPGATCDSVWSSCPAAGCDSASGTCETCNKNECVYDGGTGSSCTYTFRGTECTGCTLSGDPPVWTCTSCNPLPACDGSCTVSTDAPGGRDPDVTDGEWHHVAGVFDYPELRIYIDGILEGTTIPPVPFYIGEAANCGDYCSEHVGRDRGGLFVKPTESFNGVIDEIRLWNEARSEEYIRAGMYTEITVDNWQRLNPHNALKKYLRLNEGEGIYVIDSSGMGQNGVKESCFVLCDSYGEQRNKPWEGGWVKGLPLKKG